MKHLKVFEDVYYGGTPKPPSKEEILRKDRTDKLIRLKNPLNGKSKQSARRYVYKISSHIIEGMFTDEYWAPVSKLYKKWEEEGIEWDYHKNPQYFNFPVDDSMNLPYKQWYITIPFYNNRNNLNELVGTLTAHFNGTKDDPMKIYDLTLVI